VPASDEGASPLLSNYGEGEGRVKVAAAPTRPSSERRTYGDQDDDDGDRKDLAPPRREYVREEFHLDVRPAACRQPTASDYDPVVKIPSYSARVPLAPGGGGLPPEHLCRLGREPDRLDPWTALVALARASSSAAHSPDLALNGVEQLVRVPLLDRVSPLVALDESLHGVPSTRTS
jgi:hypothetical protein